MIDELRENPIEAIARFFPPRGPHSPSDMPLDSPNSHLAIPAYEKEQTTYCQTRSPAGSQSKVMPVLPAYKR